MDAMPFGLIFGCVVFSALGVGVGLKLFSLPGPPARLAGALMLVLGVALGLGLLMRQTWARWLGLILGVLLTFVGVALVLFRGEMSDHLALIAPLCAAILLAIPATGDVHRGLPIGTSPVRRPGQILGWTSAIAFTGLLGAGVWGVLTTDLPIRTRTHRPASSGSGEPIAESPRRPSQKVHWVDYGTGLTRAKAEGKPIVVDFFATWCGACKDLDRGTFQNPAVAERLAGVITVRVDAEDETMKNGYRGVELAQRYRVMGYPTIVFLDSSGREISRQGGAVPPKPFLGWLDASLDRSKGVASGRPVPAALSP